MFSEKNKTKPTRTSEVAPLYYTEIMKKDIKIEIRKIIMNRNYIAIGALLIIIGVPLFLQSHDIASNLVPHPDPLHESLGGYLSAMNSYHTRINAITGVLTFSGLLMGLVGLILTVIGVTVAPTAKKNISDTLEIETPKEKEDLNKINRITEIMETYNKKGYKVTKYEFEEPILKMILSKNDKTYLATFNLKTKKSKV